VVNREFSGRPCCAKGIEIVGFSLVEAVKVLVNNRNPGAGILMLATSLPILAVPLILTDPMPSIQKIYFSC
jgi:hypothetical protein